MCGFSVVDNIYRPYVPPADEVVRHTRENEAAMAGERVPEASWALFRAGPETKSDRRPAYLARRAADFARPSAARHRDVAAWDRAHGFPSEAEVQLRIALEPRDGSQEQDQHPESQGGGDRVLQQLQSTVGAESLRCDP